MRQFGCAKQGSQKSQRSEIFGKRRSRVRMRALPRRSNAREQPTAPTKKRGFRTRNLIIEKVLRQKCHFATRKRLLNTYSKCDFETRSLSIEKVLRQKCHFATRNLIIGKEIPYVVLSEAAGFLPVILSVAKRSRRISI